MTERILVVEDQEHNRRILRDLLTSAGYELIEAVTGSEGVRLARSAMPMPHGWEAATILVLALEAELAQFGPSGTLTMALSARFGRCKRRKRQ